MFGAHQIPTTIVVLAENYVGGAVAFLPHLLKITGTGDIVGCAVQSVSGHHQKRNALGARTAAGDSRQNQVNDVVYVLVLAAGDPNFLTFELVASVILRNGHSLHIGQRAPSLGLGETHGSAPFALKHGL